MEEEYKLTEDAIHGDAWVAEDAIDPRHPMGPPVVRESIRILHVDDDLNQLRMMKRFVESESCIHVDSASSTEEALLMLEQETFHCIVSDFAMRGMDGIELARKIRETSAVPFILYTGRGSEEVAVAAFEAGVDDYIRKEIAPSHYRVLIKRILDSVHQHRAKEALISSERNYRATLDSMKDAIHVVDRDLRVVLFNRAILDWMGRLGIDPGSKGEALFEVFPFLNDGVFEEYTRVFESGLSLTTEERITVSGVEFITETIKIPIYEGDALSRIVTVIRDVTDQKKMKERLHLLHEHAVELERAASDEEVLRITSNVMSETLGFETISLIKVEEGILRDVCVRGTDRGEPENQTAGPGIAARAARTGESQYVPDVKADPGYDPSRTDDAASELAVPVMVDGETAVVFHIRRPRKDAFTENDRELLETLTAHVSSAFERLRQIRDYVEIEEELRASEEKYKNLVENANEAIVVTHDGYLKFVNRKATDLMKHSREELLSMPFVEFIHPDDREMVAERHRERIEGVRTPPIYSFRVLNKEREVLWLEINAVRIQWEGRPATLNFLSDITERKSMEEQLSKSEERWRSLFELAPDSIVTMDTNGVITSVNSAFQRLTGFAQEEIVGKHFLKLDTIRVRDIPRFSKYFHDLLREGSISSFEFQFIRKQKEPRWAEAHAVLREVCGSRMEILCILRDVTSRRQSEEERQDYTSRLEELVERRSRELVDAERMATAGKVASMVAHDLRGPLQTIKNAVYLMRVAPEEGEELLETIDQSVNFAAKMLDELRDNIGDTPLNMAETSLGLLLRRALAEATIPHESESELRLDGDLDDLQLDPVKIRRVLDNLIRNAVEAMAEGGRLTVEASREGSGVSISVRDTGRGIPEDILHDLYKPFHTTKPGGSGLGLAYCKRAVGAHGGEIIVDSTVGEGTTFTIKLPTRTGG